MDNEQQQRLDRLAARRPATTPPTSTPKNPALAIPTFQPPVGLLHPAAFTFAPPDASQLIDPSIAIGSADPLGDLRRAHQVGETNRTTPGRHTRMHAAAAGRILAAGLSTSAFLGGIAIIAGNGPTASANTVPAVPVATPAPVVIVTDILVDENGNDTPAPAETVTSAAAAPVATSVAPPAPPTTVEPVLGLVAADGPPVAPAEGSVLAQDATADPSPTSAPTSAIVKAPAAGRPTPVTTSTTSAAPIAAPPSTAAPATAPAPAATTTAPAAAPVTTAAPTPAPTNPPAPATTAAPAPRTTAAPAPTTAAPAPACTGSMC